MKPNARTPRTGPFTKEQGVWVFRTGQPLPAAVTEETLRQIREARDRFNLGDRQ